jgi:hypothetical protein
MYSSKVVYDGDWVLSGENGYYAGIELSDQIRPVYRPDVQNAVVFHDLDYAEMTQLRYGGLLVSLAKIAQAV